MPESNDPLPGMTPILVNLRNTVDNNSSSGQVRPKTDVERDNCNQSLAVDVLRLLLAGEVV